MALVLVASSGCSPSAQRRYEQDLSRAPAASQHAVHSQRLQALMRSLDTLLNKRLPQAMDLESSRAMRAEEIAQVAGALSESADLIPETTLSLEMNEEDRSDFLALAERLRQRAALLDPPDASLTPAQINERIGAVAQTCDTCHDRFGIDLDPSPTR
jgi:cytochrome c556